MSKNAVEIYESLNVGDLFEINIEREAEVPGSWHNPYVKTERGFKSTTGTEYKKSIIYPKDTLVPLPRTKTVVIDNPSDYQVGDHFEGTLDYTVGTAHVVTHATGPLQQNPRLSKRFYVASSLAYVDSPNWTNVTVTREVREESKYLHFEPGAVIEHTRSGSRYAKRHNGDGWLGLTSGMEFSHSEARDSMENRGIFEKFYTVISGPEPTSDWSD